MIELGTISIQNENSIVHCRNKIRVLAVDVDFSSVQATRIATASSEICWSLLDNKYGSCVDVCIDNIDERFGLLLVFRGVPTQSKFKISEVLFDRFTLIPKDSGKQDIHAFKFFPNPAFIPSEKFIEGEKSKISQLSRDELMLAMTTQTSLVKLLLTTASDANTATNFHGAIQTCLNTVCSHTGWPIGHAFFLSDKDESVLVSSEIWHLDNKKKFSAFVKATKKSTFKTGIGLPGRVLESSQPAWIIDVTKDPNFPRAKLAEDIGVSGAFAFPVLARKKIVGVLEFFSEKHEEVDESLLSTVANIGGQLGQVYERKMAEIELLKARDEAEAATEAKATFLASMSHEIRTPMNGVIGMVDLLNQTEMAGEQKIMLDTISHSGQALLTIINDILDFSKIEAGKMDLEQIPFSVLKVVENSVQTIASNAIKKGLRIIPYIDPKIPPFVVGDPVRIRQIIINLGGNAIKFSREGSVVIRADLVKSNDDLKTTIRFSVIDQGIGLSEEGQAKLFQAYAQAESSTTREFGGTGLGLTICKTLTGLMGGEIGVNSKLGEGSEFFSIIPFAASNKQAEKLTATDLGGLRVLLVTTNLPVIPMLQNYLEHWKVETDIDDNLPGVIDMCKTASDDGAPFDVVLIGPEWPLKEALSIADEAFDIGLKTRFVFGVKRDQQLVEKDKDKGIFLKFDPLLRASFVSAIAMAAGRESPEVHYEEEVEDLKSDVKALSVEEAREQGTLILVAEDNETNRDVIGRQLNLLGYTCEMAEDGEIALDAWRNTNYGILLTDCNMPHMDGFELTNAIRKDEEGTVNHAKIIAITANALQGEAERCLESGMDDYMSKPINIKELKAKLQEWLPQANGLMEQIAEQSSNNTNSEAAVSKGDNNPVNEKVLKGIFGDDQEIFREILGDFIAPSKALINDIQIGLDQHSAEGIKQAAHKLKSSALTVGAIELGELSQKLEEAGKKDDWKVIENETPKLEPLMIQVEEYISTL